MSTKSNRKNTNKKTPTAKPSASVSGPLAESPQEFAERIDLRAKMIDLIPKVEAYFTRLFEDVWIPRLGLSKGGNIYVTLVIKPSTHLFEMFDLV